jgi:hypothetical protein
LDLVLNAIKQHDIYSAKAKEIIEQQSQFIKMYVDFYKECMRVGSIKDAK